jgi:hypothetical protein
MEMAMIMQVIANETFHGQKQSKPVTLMAALLGKLLAAMALILAVWTLGTSPPRTGESWVRPSGMGPGPVRILQFYSSVGSIKAGEKALLCYGVENAKSVRIAPMMEGESPSPKHCLEVAPLHTTHYTILAEGFDGHVVMRSLTLPVDATVPHVDDRPRWLADVLRNRTFGA